MTYICRSKQCTQNMTYDIPDLQLATKHFAILKETFELNQLTEKQILDLRLTKSDKKVLRILICE